MIINMGQGEGEGGINWESSTDTIMCKTASAKLRYSAGSSAQCSVVTWRAGMGVGGGLKGRIYIHIYKCVCVCVPTIPSCGCNW